MRIWRIAAAAALALSCQSPEERLSEHLARGAEYFENEQWAEAKIEYLNALRVDPDDPNAHYRLAEVLWNLEEYGEGRWQYKEAVRLDPENLEARLKLARVETLVQNHKEASEHIEFILERDPKRAQAYVLRAILASQNRQFDEMLADLERALEIDPNQGDALRLKARVLEGRQDWEGAEAAYRRLTEAQNTSASHVFLAMFLAARDRKDEALEAYKAAVEAARSEPERLRTRLVLANAYLSMGRPEDAEAELKSAQEANPENDQLLLALARFYAARGEVPRAEQLLELRAAASEEPGPMLALADFYRSTGDEQKMRESVDRALERDPESEIARLRKAEILLEVGVTDPEAAKEARRLLSSVLERNPDSVPGLFTQGKFLLVDGRPEEAATRLRRVVDEQPSAAAYLLLGTAYMGMNEPELARAELLRALQLDPTSVPVRAQLASLYAQIGEKELAIEEANVALERMPNNLQLITLLAGTLHGLGRDDEAAEVLDRITMEEHADVPRARLILAELYRKVGKTERARELLTEQQQITPNDVTIPAQLALLDLADRDPLGALKRLDEGIERFPENALLWELRARVRLGFMRQGQLVYPDEAEADLKKSIELGTQRIEAYMLLASLYRRSNRLEDAIKTYEQARDAAPGDATLHLVLGTLYEQLGRRDDAIREYEAVIRIDPEQGVALNNLAWLLATRDPENARTLDRALQLAQQAKEVLPESPSVADTLGYVMLKKKIPSAAISLFREAMDGYEKGDPVRSVVRYHLAQAYEVSGDRGRAIEELQLALAEAAAFPERSAAEAMLKSLQES